MFLLEHDGKSLLARCGLPVAAGVLLDTADFDPSLLPTGPWMVKAQVAAGGRGKAGLVRAADDLAAVRRCMADMLGATHRSMIVRSCRVETRVAQAHEAYLSFTLDAQAAGVRVMLAADGGVDIEAQAQVAGAVRSLVLAPEADALDAGIARLVDGLSPRLSAALGDAARRLARVFVDEDLTLLEINPLFVHVDGTWLAGDARIVTDDNASYRQAGLRALIDDRAVAYPEAWRKEHHGCDYVVVDPQGDIGLLTTGAGLSMMLIDEMRAAGLRPHNFLDVRTGGLRGDPTRLVDVLRWISEGPRVKVLLVNIFAGITDLGEFSNLLLEALSRVPQFKVPVVARLVGTRVDAARTVLAARGIALHTSLDEALAQVRVHLGEGVPA